MQYVIVTKMAVFTSFKHRITPELCHAFLSVFDVVLQKHKQTSTAVKDEPKQRVRVRSKSGVN